MRARRSMSFRTLLVSAAILASARTRLVAQAASAPNSAATYMERYREIAGLQPDAGRVAQVNHLVITRDAGQLVLEHGQLVLLTPVGGRIVGAVFRGDGRFTFAPTIPVERAELQRFSHSPSLDDPITQAVMIFADSTPEQLQRLTFAPGQIPGDYADHVHDLVNSFKGAHEGSFNGAVVGPLLNGETNGLFVAMVGRSRGDPLLFVVDPSLSEAIQLFHPVSRIRWGSPWAVVAQFPPTTSVLGTADAWRYRDRLEVPAYQLDVRLTEALSGNLGLGARATFALSAIEAVGPWLRFSLDYRLHVDSARRSDGENLTTFKADESGDLWVRAGRRLAPGDTTSLTVFYHGDMIDRFANFFFVEPGSAWYPINAQGVSLATFDLTFHGPARYPLVSIGERTDTSVADHVLTTHWLSRLPTSFASFNLGLFENYHVQHPGAPPLDVMLSEDAHAALRQAAAHQGVLLSQQSHMKENVAADVSNSLMAYSNLFGDAPFTHFYVTEIPYGEGVSFPGLIDLSWGTFQNTSLDGFDEFFRAHEAAHQWWGNGVRPGSYRDAWLSEGLASFSALWYLRLERHRDTEYYRFLDEYRGDVFAVQDAGPIWIGYRASSLTVQRGYDVLTYEKGAWVFHMLRVLMTDIRTMSPDRFTETLRDFYQSFRGRPATTDDFRQLVERHIGAPMDWFFDQWVKGTAIPTYHVAWTSEPTEDGRYRVHFRITQEHVPAEFHMPVLVAVDLGDQRVGHFRVNVSGAQTDYLGPPLPGQARTVTFNDQHSVLADVKLERW